jgi:hydrogenase maturation factor
VCFEHPGLLTVPKEECTDEVCITCSDEGRLAEVITTATDGTAMVRSANGTETVMATLVGPLAAGDLVLVHAGMVISTMAEE